MVKILIVDDSGYTRKMIADLLKVEGFKKIEEASSGEEALKIFETEKSDIVLLDIILTGIDGISVLKQMKKKNPKTKVIIITAVGQESYMKEANEAGAYSYMIKPITPKSIIEKIKEATAGIN